MSTLQSNCNSSASSSPPRLQQLAELWHGPDCSSSPNSVGLLIVVNQQHSVLVLSSRASKVVPSVGKLLHVQEALYLLERGSLDVFAVSWEQENDQLVCSKLSLGV